MKKVIVLLIVAFVSFTNVMGQTADEYFQKGNEKLKIGDKQGALLDLNAAIKVNAHFLNAFLYLILILGSIIVTL